jgi:Phosphorylase superfamily
MTRIRPEPFDHPELFSLISEFYSPILSGKHYGQPSAFAPANLLREARRQKGLPSSEVPPVCVLDPDGDIVRHLRKDGHAKPDPAWACYDEHREGRADRTPNDAGATWTRDAPYRETEEAIAAMTAKGLLAVEMEAAALYAFAAARQKPVLCIAHVTNQMARVEGDFEKGEANGSLDALAIIRAAADGFLKVFNE